ncbi:1743_t:CDS:1 [Diversispora eburnea]|uniref:1743_t:CDS:1 n=1 Tax=Diversispora eburnea TaxID=1213867 RepID=A0A9N8W9B0_9GLOM|nr:1743_t:CDS:1 [Diversispora eburnea]
MKQNRSHRSHPYTLATRSFRTIRSGDHQHNLFDVESQFFAPNLESNNKSRTLSPDENSFQNYNENEYLPLENNEIKSNSCFNRVDLSTYNSELTQHNGYNLQSHSHFNYNEVNVQELYAKIRNPIGSNTSVENNNFSDPLYQISMKLISIRDKLYMSSDENHIMRLVSELIEESKSVNSLTLETQLDLEMKFVITTLAKKIADLCNKEVELVHHIFSKHKEFVENTSFLFKEFQNLDPKRENSKRQKTDPMATLWFIKYLLDNDLQRPDKKQRNWLSLWTNMMLHDVNRWFIRTNNNYIKKNEKETARKKLTERAKITSKQLRNTFKACDSKNKMSSKRSQPYDKEGRGRKPNKSEI